MVDQIEIRACGEVRCSSLTVGRITLDAGFVQDYVGDWVPGDLADIETGNLAAELEQLGIDCDEAERERDESIEDATRAMKALEGLQDEVRAFLAGGSTCKTALERLRDALEASE